MRWKAMLLAMVAVFAVGALTATPAFAEELEKSTSWSILASPKSTKFKTASSETRLITEGGTELKCKESAVNGNLKEGMKLEGEALEKAVEVSEATWNKGTETCEGGLFGTFKIQALPVWYILPLWRLRFHPGLIWIHIVRIILHITGSSGCKFLVAGLVGGLLHTDLRPWRLLFSRALNKEFGGNELTVEKVEGECLGLVKEKEKPSIETVSEGTKGGYEGSEPSELLVEAP